MIHNYLSNRKQRVKVGPEFSEWQVIKSEVPQGLVLEPLFFDIFKNDLLFEVKESEICNFADDTTICTNGNSVESVILSLDEDLSKTLDWFKYNHTAANPGKFKTMFLEIREQPKLILEINDITKLMTEQWELILADNCPGQVMNLTLK